MRLTILIFGVLMVACRSASAPPRAELASRAQETPSASAGPSASLRPVASAKPSDGRCQIGIADGAVRIRGQRFDRFRVEAIHLTFGSWDRQELVQSKQRYEEHDIEPGMSRTSMVVNVTNYYYVYDDLGLVFHTRNSHFSKNRQPDMLLVFFGNERHFDNVALPPVLPRRQGVCTVDIGGSAINASARLVPEGVTYKTAGIQLFGLGCDVTSFATRIDGVYCYDTKPALRFFLDTASAQRPSWVEVIL